MNASLSEIVYYENFPFEHGPYKKFDFAETLIFTNYLRERPNMLLVIPLKFSISRLN